jgi:hypothetical protein
MAALDAEEKAEAEARVEEQAREQEQEYIATLVGLYLTFLGPCH